MPTYYLSVDKIKLVKWEIIRIFAVTFRTAFSEGNCSETVDDTDRFYKSNHKYKYQTYKNLQL